MKVELEGGESFDIDPSVFKIDETNLNYELCNLGATMLEYGNIEGRLKVEVEDKKAKLEKTEADIYLTARQAAKDNNIKVTEAQLDNTVKCTDQYQAARTALTNSQRNHNLARAAMISLSAKRDCLIALSYRDRQLAKADQW